MAVTSREGRAQIWDYLRRRYTLNIRQYSNKAKMEKDLRRQMGLRKYERASPKQRAFLNRLFRKSDFWRESKKDLGKPSPWRRKGQEKLSWRERDLLELSKRYKGRELVERYNRMTGEQRSYAAVTTKASKLKKPTLYYKGYRK